MMIEEAARELKLSYTREYHDSFIKEANQRGLNFEEALTELLTEEVSHRRNRSYQRRITQAKFQQKKYLADFDDTIFPETSCKQLRALTSLEFIKRKENAILIGNPGTGKTHFSIAIGIEACLQGFNVQFVNAPNLIIQLKEAVTQSQFVRFKRRFESVDLVIIDELGYLSFDESGAELLFNLLSNRNDKGSIMITSNLTFDRWHECFKDTTLTAALVDRLAYQAHVIDMRGESYRIKQTSSWIDSMTTN